MRNGVRTLGTQRTAKQRRIRLDAVPGASDAGLTFADPEIERALACSSQSSAPGPDTIPNSGWKKINKTPPHLILKLLSPLVSYDFHPFSLNKADSIVLHKP